MNERGDGSVTVEASCSRVVELATDVTPGLIGRIDTTGIKNFQLLEQKGCMGAIDVMGLY